MMFDDHNIESAASEIELAELLARVGNIFVRKNLSPPFHLKPAVEGWLRQGVTPAEIVRIVQEHLQSERHRYSGSGDSSLASSASKLRGC
jgi:hypothetical protein